MYTLSDGTGRPASVCVTWFWKRTRSSHLELGNSPSSDTLHSLGSSCGGASRSSPLRNAEANMSDSSGSWLNALPRRKRPVLQPVDGHGVRREEGEAHELLRCPLQVRRVRGPCT